MPKKSLPLLVMPAPESGVKEEEVVEVEDKLAVTGPPQQKRSLPVLVSKLKVAIKITKNSISNHVSENRQSL